MNKLQLKKSLSDCHIKNTDDLTFYEDSGTKYLLQRAKEEIVKLDKELAKDVQQQDTQMITKRIIQLILMVRVKTDETLRKEGNSSRRARSKNTGSLGVVSQNA